MNMNKTNPIRKLAAAFLLAVLALPLSAQDKADSVFTFRFLPGKDMFFAPALNNGEELARLLDCVQRHKEMITSYEIPLHVDGYCTSGKSKADNLALARTRSNRVKSELITRKGLTEECFITRNHAEQGDFVTVRIIIPKNGIQSMPQEKDKEAQEETTVPTVKEGKKETVRQEETQTAQATRPEESLPVKAVKEGRDNTGSLALRTNLLRWATLTPDLGVEWRVNCHVGIAVNGSWTSWTWDDKDRRYALWEVNPEVRWYLGKEKRGYIGAMYKAGSFNYKFSETGKQGDLMGGGITGGYQLKLNDALSLDFSLGVGYVNADTEKYTVIDGVRVRQGKESKNWWGPTQAGVTLVWTIF